MVMLADDQNFLIRAPSPHDGKLCTAVQSSARPPAFVPEAEIYARIRATIRAVREAVHAMEQAYRTPGGGYETTTG